MKGICKLSQFTMLFVIYNFIINFSLSNPIGQQAAAVETETSNNQQQLMGNMKENPGQDEDEKASVEYERFDENTILTRKKKGQNGQGNNGYGNGNGNNGYGNGKPGYVASPGGGIQSATITNPATGETAGTTPGGGMGQATVPVPIYVNT